MDARADTRTVYQYTTPCAWKICAFLDDSNRPTYAGSRISFVLHCNIYMYMYMH